MGDKENARKSLEYVLKESKDETLLGLDKPIYKDLIQGRPRCAYC